VLEGEPDTREVKFDETNPFDQTLPLLIAGYARVLIPGMGWVQATLSPQWFESIMGRVMACTCQDSFDTDLVIEKKISRYHPDGTDHYEIYKFRGFSQEIAPNVRLHNYQSQSSHPFYPSGKTEDISVEPINDLLIILNRVAESIMIPCPGIPGKRIVQSVRGRYQGPAYVNLNRIMSNGMQIGAGEVQLSDPHHPIAGQLTNTFLFGTFKGKISDLNGDGYLDLNTEKCHGTPSGELDYSLTLKPNPDPFE